MFYLYAYLRLHDGGSKAAIVCQDEDPYSITERMVDELGLGLSDIIYGVFTGTVMIDEPAVQIDYEAMIRMATPEERDDG